MNAIDAVKHGRDKNDEREKSENRDQIIMQLIMILNDSQKR